MIVETSLAVIKRGLNAPAESRLRSPFQSVVFYRIWVALLILFVVSIGARTSFSANSSDEQEIKLLTIGNSFADNATRYLVQLAESRGKRVKLGKANLGGSDLARHAKHLSAYLANPTDPEGKPYGDQRSSDQSSFSLVEALQSDDWDFVTLQQVSRNSFKPETFEPYLGQIVDAVRRYAPQAELLVHQTWAYRRDHEFFENGAFTQQAMFDGIRMAYEDIATQYEVDSVPVGHAFQIARSMRHWFMVIPDPEFNYENPIQGEMPDQTGSLNVGWRWKENRTSGIREFVLDATHANNAGSYLGSCVFYEAITGENVRELSWHPDDLSDRQAQSLREAAHKAMAARNLESEFYSIFDGKSLDGWDGDPTYWRVENGALVGEVTEKTTLQRNSFIIWRGGEPGDFELKVEYRVTGEGNSGLSYRNIQLADAPWSLSGYQADIDGRAHEKRTPRQRYTGQAWEERGRRFLALLGEIVQIDETGESVVIGSLGDWEELETHINEEDWNEYHVVARGNVLTYILNGRVTSIVIDDDPENRRMNGLIGVQVHTGPPHKIEYRNFRLKEL